jgi:hypothetical protein
MEDTPMPDETDQPEPEKPRPNTVAPRFDMIDVRLDEIIKRIAMQEEQINAIVTMQGTIVATLAAIEARIELYANKGTT